MIFKILIVACVTLANVFGQNANGQNTAIAGLSFPAQSGQNSADQSNSAIASTLNSFSAIPSGNSFTGVNNNAAQATNGVQTGMPGQNLNTLQTGIPGQNTLQNGLTGQNQLQPGMVAGQQIPGNTGFPAMGMQNGFNNMNALNGQFPRPGGFIGQTGFPGQMQTGMPGMFPNGRFPGQIGMNGQPGFPGQTGFMGQQFPGQQAFPGQTGFTPAGGLTGQPGSTFGQPGFQGGPLGIAPRGCHQSGCPNGQQCVYAPQTFGQPQTAQYMCPNWIPILTCQCQQGCRAQNQFIPFGQSRQIDQCGNVCTCNSQTGQAACTMRACPNQIGNQIGKKK